jgi:hypothetical protein
VAKAATLRSAPAIEVAMLRSGRVLQRSKNRFDSPMATSAGHLFSLIASARLHRLEPEEYLRDLFRILGQWPRDRYLELAPKYWAATRARLDPVELANEVGPLTIPPALPPEKQMPAR